MLQHGTPAIRGRAGPAAGRVAPKPEGWRGPEGPRRRASVGAVLALVDRLGGDHAGGDDGGGRRLGLAGGKDAGRGDGDEVTFIVQDGGPGIPAEQQARLFQRFRGAGAGSGSGLGLYLTRRIAEAHGGTVRYRRTARAQSQFVLTLPEAPHA